MIFDEIPPKLKFIWTWNLKASLKERGKYVFTARVKTQKVEKL
jgi:hypothetical protein